MDSARVVLFLLINMITLDHNLAESASSDAGSVLKPKFRRFQWRSLDGKPARRSRQHRSSSFELDDEDGEDAQARAVYWIPTNCDPAVERGYTCIGCGESLHCMGGGFALKAVCFGRRPYCSNGVCSSIRGEKCNKNHETAVQAAAAPSSNTTIVYDAVPEESPVVPVSNQQELPAKKHDKPAKEPEIPTIEHEKPAMENEKPVIENEKPAIEYEKPAIENELPAIEQETPTQENEVPEREPETLAHDKVMLDIQQLSGDKKLSVDQASLTSGARARFWRI